jgi:single-strand DNA-binding protein
MVYETNVTIVGRLISDPEHKQTRNDVEVTNFRMASNERKYDKDTQQWIDGDSLFVTVTCWRRLAFGVRACLKKGDPVIVTGRLFSRGFEVDGKKRSVTEMEATAVGPDLARCTLQIHGRRDDRPAQPAPAAESGAIELPGGDVMTVDSEELVASAA